MSPQASPLVVVLKRPDADGHHRLRLAVDYRWVNKFTELTVPNLEDMGDLIQAVGNSRLISYFYANSGSHQTPVKESDRWLTSFVCDLGQFQCLRTPFARRNSGTTFVRAVQLVLQSHRAFVKSYVDGMAVHSDTCSQHLNDVERYLKAIKEAGFTSGIKKCEFAKPYVRYIGHVIGSGERRVDPTKVETVRALR
jgi:hypothetical protein